jgi:hypothetical protein
VEDEDDLPDDEPVGWTGNEIFGSCNFPVKEEEEGKFTTNPMSR